MWTLTVLSNNKVQEMPAQAEYRVSRIWVHIGQLYTYIYTYIYMYKLKAKLKHTGTWSDTHGRPARPVIAQQYSSNNYVTSRFQPHTATFGASF